MRLVLLMSVAAAMLVSCAQPVPVFKAERLDERGLVNGLFHIWGNVEYAPRQYAAFAYDSTWLYGNLNGVNPPEVIELTIVFPVGEAGTAAGVSGKQATPTHMQILMPGGLEMRLSGESPLTARTPSTFPAREQLIEWIGEPGIGTLRGPYGRMFRISWQSLGMDGPPVGKDMKIVVRALQPTGPGAAFAFGSTGGPRPPIVVSDYLPLKKGNYWTYTGQIIAAADKGTPKEMIATLTTRVLDAIPSRNGQMTLFVMQGDINGLIWAGSVKDMEIAGKAKYGMLVVGNKVYRSDGERLGDLSEFVRQAEGISTEEPSVLTLEFEFPLFAGQKFDEPASARNDGLYAWRVTLETPESGSERFLLTYKSLPDDTTVVFEPYLGIVRFDYSHHGTICEAHLRLADYRVHTKAAPKSSPTSTSTASPVKPAS
jgi:hypothetical protein